MNEYEIISHSSISYDIFLNEILYRAPHFHKDFEIGVLLRGTMKFTTPNESITLTQNDLWIVNPFEHHEYSAIDGQPLVLIIQINPAFFSSYFGMINNVAFSSYPIPLADAKYDDLHKLVISVAKQYFYQSERFELKCAMMLNWIFDKVMSYIPYSMITDVDRKTKKSKLNLIRKITAYVDENYYHKLLLTDIAQETNLTVNYLSHFFKDAMGISFQRYLAQIRCHQAAVMLSTTDLSLIDISISCGFSDSKYFTKNFMEFYGVHPNVFKRNSSLKNSNNYLNPAESKNATITTERKLSPVVRRKTIDYYYQKLEIKELATL